MGATPTHQTDTQVLDNVLWEAEGILRVPPCVETDGEEEDVEGMPRMEGGAVPTRCAQEKCPDSSLGSTAPASMPATRGPWSRTTSLKDWYPDEHPFIRNTCDSDDPNETPCYIPTGRLPRLAMMLRVCSSCLDLLWVLDAPQGNNNRAMPKLR